MDLSKNQGINPVHVFLCGSPDCPYHSHIKEKARSVRAWISIPTTRVEADSCPTFSGDGIGNFQGSHRESTSSLDALLEEVAQWQEKNHPQE